MEGTPTSQSWTVLEKKKKKSEKRSKSVLVSPPISEFFPFNQLNYIIQDFLQGSTPSWFS